MIVRLKVSGYLNNMHEHMNQVRPNLYYDNDQTLQKRGGLQAPPEELRFLPLNSIEKS